MIDYGIVFPRVSRVDTYPSHLCVVTLIGVIEPICQCVLVVVQEVVSGVVGNVWAPVQQKNTSIVFLTDLPSDLGSVGVFVNIYATST